MKDWHWRHPADWPALHEPLLPSLWRGLPRELVLFIVEGSSWLVPTATLHRWCLVDRAWYRRAVTPLYACVVLSPRDGDTQGAWRIERFCDTISCNKQLANSVKALDFAISREEEGIANQGQYLTILTHCRNLLYLRNLQRLRDPEETYLLSVPSGALARLRWHDSDLRAFEELVESVFKPLHFRSNPDARGIVRSDMIATDARSAGRMLYDLRLLARLPSVHKLPKGFFRRMISSQLPRQKVLTARCSKNYQNDRVGTRIAMGIIQIVSRLFEKLELIEIYLADRDFHTGAPLHFVSKGSRTGLPCLYPRSFWDDSISQLLALGPLPFAVAVYHVCSNEVGDAPGFDIGGDYDLFPTEQAPTSDIEALGEEYPYTFEEDDLTRRTTTGHGWQEPFLLLPNSTKIVPIKLKGGYRTLPFTTYRKKGKAAWEALVDPPEDIMPDKTQLNDAQEEWDVESMLGASRPRPSNMHPLTPRRGSLDWLRLVSRNLEFDQHDLFL
ncbi:uncharacterized protein MEPE_04194 [Melanopsichium pennsylvanicum]|uniref:Uncharacterized protein n=2 Tax=Melanopsichium pennsylvanicum TaxID=63383 RepID=A0AAJ5C664_9BASI|nr:putative protein [Melanopsichium pennsylvanicum 4]SNX85485.1 uncharacterized protein MEPE_04194 [Melanopsichium pennsylvanicum]